MEERREEQARVACGKLLLALESVLEESKSRGGGGGVRTTTPTPPRDTREPRGAAVTSDFEGAVSSTVDILDLREVRRVATPAFVELVNFSPQKPRSRCVMCGRNADDGAVIPRQNKSVCRECDKAVWVHKPTGATFKWCKGCKRFHSILQFEGKLRASKCDPCREKGRLGYFRRLQKEHHLHDGTTLADDGTAPPEDIIIEASSPGATTTTTTPLVVEDGGDDVDDHRQDRRRRQKSPPFSV
mmetsp:Transcript_5170/g.16937  ORF Transcript_5170/g.16937 Transcript_5170/m.16937 type:complete len:243 (+) Transcript_5170:71-799(+)